MIEWKLRSILRKIRSKNPQKRYEAISRLFQYKQQDDLEIQIDVLKDAIKIAASKFPDRVDNWDYPSYYLIDFVCDFPRPEIVDGLLKYFDDFDIQAKERAVEFLLTSEDEEIFYFLEEKIIDLMQKDDFDIPTSQLSTYPILVKGILDKTLDKLSSNQYKFDLYELILSFNYSGHEIGFKKEVILPFLLEDYRNEKKEYLKFDSDYSTKFVYTAWKGSYFAVRNRMKLLIQLMEYYYTPEVGSELESAQYFKDPFLRTIALLICMSKNLPYEQSTLLGCATHIESAYLTYWELVERKLEHLYPLDDRKQAHLAKSTLFFAIIEDTWENDEQILFPEDIRIEGKVETKNTYGDPMRYYLMSFSEDGTRYVGWVGGFTVKDDDNTADLYNETYTDFIKLDSASIEEHKRDFFVKKEEENLENESYIYFESSPKIRNIAWFLLFPLIGKWLRIVFGNYDSLLLTILFTLVVGLLFIYEITKNKNRKISISGQQLVKQDGSTQQNIGLQNIKKVEHTKKHIIVYDQSNEIALKFPLRWTRYEQFYQHMKAHTDHLENPPFIQT
ncbi:hypothetical protein [Sporosarcina jiandibaonis]|uniref:hypothetical protein n=1 Tax=Sporosarcina jiandibaonis TaxID=2715535 RepID=UPI001552FB0A|nr:hypothetical protein [Sporosarcina jiandibaonis]